LWLLDEPIGRSWQLVGKQADVEAKVRRIDADDITSQRGKTLATWRLLAVPKCKRLAGTAVANSLVGEAACIQNRRGD
jgi:hypothetical protein